MSIDQSYNEMEMFRRIADGDQAAFADLFKRYFDELYQVLFKYTQRHADTEDIVQTVFLRAWEKREVFREMQDPMNWFFITARNEYLNRLRKNRLSRQYYQHLAEVFQEPGISPESIFINKQNNTLYRQAIDNLPEKQQQAYLLSREKGLTYDEIAMQMNIRKTTVKEHIARAVHSIRVFLLSQTDKIGDIILLLFFLKIMSSSFLFHLSLL